LATSGFPHFLWKDLFTAPKGPQSSPLDALKKNILFHTLSRSELKYLSNLVYERTYLPDEPIFQQNERGLGVYVIVQGTISIRTQSPHGEIQVAELRDGNFFGELALVDPENVRTASAIAAERSVLVGFFKPDLVSLMESKPDMGVKILYQLAVVLGRRLKATTEKITRMTRDEESRKQ
jgi:CRP/FNR family transcriptional regulator, cyclic AMP receptor protein